MVHTPVDLSERIIKNSKGIYTAAKGYEQYTIIQ
jgi:hypothetical protein